MEMGMEVINKDKNPMIVVSSDEVVAWLRAMADEAGYADRATCAMQITVRQPFAGGSTIHHEPPELLLMVSGIPNSRTP